MHALGELGPFDAGRSVAGRATVLEIFARTLLHRRRVGQIDAGGRVISRPAQDGCGTHVEQRPFNRGRVLHAAGDIVKSAEEIDDRSNNESDGQQADEGEKPHVCSPWVSGGNLIEHYSFLTILPGALMLK